MLPFNHVVIVCICKITFTDVYMSIYMCMYIYTYSGKSEFIVYALIFLPSKPLDSIVNTEVPKSHQHQYCSQDVRENDEV